MNFIYHSGIMLMPLLTKDIFNWRLYLQSDQKVLSSFERGKLEAKVAELAQRHGVHKPLMIIERRGLGNTAEACGNSILPGRAGIAIDPEWVKSSSDDLVEFVLAHEIAHIKKNHNLKLLSLGSLLAIISLAAMTLLCKRPLVTVAMAIGLLPLFPLSKRVEKEADLLGFKVCSRSAQRAAIHWFDNLEDSFDPYHPPSSHRAEYLRQAQIA